MKHIIEQLMQHARTEHDSIDMGAPFGLVTMVEKQIESHQVKASARGMINRFGTGQKSIMTNGSSVWPMMLSNVLNNAIDHACESSTIYCEIRTLQNSFTLRVSNPCNVILQRLTWHHCAIDYGEKMLLVPIRRTVDYDWHWYPPMLNV